MLHVDDTAYCGGRENDFTEVSTGDDVKHLDSLLVSSKSVSESDQIRIFREVEVYRFLICRSIQALVVRWA